jgi:Rieske Fe-S protein
MVNRRCFLRVLGATTGLACAPWVLACGGGDAEGQPEAHGRFPGGNVSALTPGEPRVVSGQPVVLVLDDQGVYAMSTICSHAACDMRNDGAISASGLNCACHGSVFALDGQPTAGPARRTLLHFTVEIDAAGELTIDADQRVDAATRTPVV